MARYINIRLISKFLVLVVAIQVLNVSIDSQEFTSLATASHTVGEHNQINSIVEYVAEIVLNKVNAFPEFHHHGHKDLQLHKHLSSLKIVITDRIKESPGNTIFSQSFFYPLKDDYQHLYLDEINPPPPKA